MTAALMVAMASIAALGQVDVPRRTTAVTYPLDEQVMLNFRGTTRFPRMKGEAKVRRTARNGTQIELSVSKMPRPFELGAGYATYVLWAISPDGQAANLGEIKRRGFFEFDSKINVTTPLQTFALLITAEPHFLVRRPSQQVMLENLNPFTQSGKVISTVPAVQYFGNSSDYFRDSRTPEIAEVDYSRTPSTILQAKQAVALARFAGAEVDAQAELGEANTLLQNAEGAWRAGRAEEEVDITARRAISAAVKAEELAITRAEARQKRNERSRSDAEIRRAEDRLADAQAEIAELKAEINREMRNRELAERDVMNTSTQVKELREENGRLREELGRVKVELDAAKAKLAATEAEKSNIQQEREAEARANRIRANEPGLMAALRSYGTVTKTEKGIVLSIPEAVWANTRSSALTPQGVGKVNSLADILASNPDYAIEIETHTDNTGTPEVIQSVTDGRARLISERLAAFGIDETRIAARGYGASLPIAPNTTAVNKAKNRRTILTLVLRN